MTFFGRPGSSEVTSQPSDTLDVSSIPVNGIFLTKKKKNAQRVENEIRLHGRRAKGIIIIAESFSREKLRHAPQKEGG